MLPNIFFNHLDISAMETLQILPVLPFNNSNLLVKFTQYCTTQGILPLVKVQQIIQLAFQFSAHLL